MVWKRNMQALGSLVVVALVMTGHAAQSDGNRVGLAVEALENTIDGSELRGCLTRGDTETGKAQIAWVDLARRGGATSDHHGTRRMRRCEVTDLR